jgi:predicted  nucleic acid-binding Zn-ribbon protein
MGVELDIPWSGYSYIEQAMLCVYILDVILRIRWNGCRAYMTDKTHLVDITIVLASVFEVWIVPMTIAVEASLQTEGKRKRGSLLTNLTMTLRAFRLVRAVRLIKLVKFAKPLYMILQSMSAAFARVCWVMALIGVFLYAFSLIFTQLLGRDMLDALPGDDPTMTTIRRRFSSVPRTFFELFRVMCGDVTDFGYLISAENNFIVPVAYMVFQVTTPWLILSIFTAEVVDTTITTSQVLDREEKAMQALHSRTVQRVKITNQLYDLFSDVQNAREMQYIELNHLASFLEDEDNIQRLFEIAGLTAFQAINAWEAIENDGAAHMEDYVDGLVLASHQSHEHSILRMEAQIRGLLRGQTAMLSALEVPSIPGRRLSISREGKYTSDDLDGQGLGNGFAQPSFAQPSVPEPAKPYTGFSGIWSEMSGLREEVRAGLVQLQSSMQAVQTDQNSIRRGVSATKEAEHKAVAEVRKIQRDLSESNSHIHGALLGLSDVRNDISALCKQANASRSPQIDELRGEVHQLRNEVTHVARTEDMGHLADALVEVQKMQRDLSESNSQISAAVAGIGDVRNDIAALCEQPGRGQATQIDELSGKVNELCSEVARLAPSVASVAERGSDLGLTDVQAGIDALRNEIASLSQTLCTEQRSTTDASGESQVDEMRAEFTSLQAGIETLRSEIVALAQTLQAEQLSSTGSCTGRESGGVDALREEIASLSQVLCAERPSGSGECSGREIDQMRADFLGVRSGVQELRADIAKLAQTFNNDQPSSGDDGVGPRIEGLRADFAALQGGVEALHAEIASMSQTLRGERLNDSGLGCSGAPAAASCERSVDERPAGSPDRQSAALAEARSEYRRRHLSESASQGAAVSDNQTVRGQSDSPLLQRLRQERRNFCDAHART